MFSFAIYGETKSRPLNISIIITLVFGLFIFSMIYSLFKVNGQTLKFAYSYTSVISVLFGFSLSYIIITEAKGIWYKNLGFQIIPVWLILFGIREWFMRITAE